MSQYKEKRKEKKESNSSCSQKPRYLASVGDRDRFDDLDRDFSSFFWPSLTIFVGGSIDEKRMSVQTYPLLSPRSAPFFREIEIRVKITATFFWKNRKIIDNRFFYQQISKMKKNIKKNGDRN